MARKERAPLPTPAQAATGPSSGTHSARSQGPSQSGRRRSLQQARLVANQVMLGRSAFKAHERKGQPWSHKQCLSVQNKVEIWNAVHSSGRLGLPEKSSRRYTMLWYLALKGTLTKLRIKYRAKFGENGNHPCPHLSRHPNDRSKIRIQHPDSDSRTLFVQPARIPLQVGKRIQLRHALPGSKSR
jgi:hypothetical protein